MTRPSPLAGAPELDRPDPAVSFALKLGRALHVYGAPAHRLEEAMRLVCEQLGIEGQFFSTPTSLLLGLGPLDRQRTYLLRVEPGGVDLEKQSLLHDVVNDLAARTCSVEQAGERVDAIVSARPRYGPALMTLCWGVASATAAVFFGGGIPEFVAAFAIGLLAGLIAMAAERSPQLSRVQEAASAVLASAIAALAASFFGVSATIAVLGGLIVLLPGLTITTAMTELGTRNLVSGTARLSAAIITFLQLGFGAALGGRLADVLPAAPTVAPVELGAWAHAAALAASPLSFAVLFRARPRDVPWVVTAGLVAFFAARLGSVLWAPEVGLFVATLLLGVLSNVWSRALRRPAAVAIVPGIILLVPGSLGWRSLGALMEHDVVSGLQTAFTVAQMAVALAAGLLLANVAVPPRRAL